MSLNPVVLFHKVTRSEVVLALGAIVAGEQVLQDQLTKGVSIGTALHVAVVAAGAFIARSQVFSKNAVVQAVENAVAPAAAVVPAPAPAAPDAPAAQ